MPALALKPWVTVMHAVRHIAVNVFRESVRDRVPYNLVIFAILLISASYLLGQLTAGQDVKIIKDLGLAATSVFGLFIAIFIELMLITAIALFFSTFSSPILSAALTFGLYIVGHFNADLKNFENVVDSKPAVWLARSLYYILPDLSAFDVKMQVVHGLTVPAGYLLSAVGYGAGYIAALLLVATVIFSRRDFK